MALDWYESTAYSLVEGTASCDNADPANHTVKRNTLTGVGMIVTVRDNDQLPIPERHER